MKNYPLLPLDHKKQWIAWNKTYLTELDHNINSLWDYNNYFIPDYAEKSLDFVGSAAIEATQLDYHEYFRALTDTDVLIAGTSSKIRLGAGYLLVSKARNEGSINYVDREENYFVQPFGYGSFYIFTNDNTGQFVGIYDPYAEETYGLNYQFSLFDHYPRFVSVQRQEPVGRAWTLVACTPRNTQKKAICTQGGTLWTDIVNIKPMFFHFITSTGEDLSSYEYGEEVIIDSIHSHSINIDKINVAQYNEIVLEKGNDNIWPTNIITRVI